MDSSMELKPTFLGLPSCELSTAEVIIVPIPFELTVSYCEGTEMGPQATIAASQQVEVDDQDLGVDLSKIAFHTAPAWSSDAGSLAEQLESISEHVGLLSTENGLPIFLGGEHGILPAIVRSIMRSERASKELTIIQIDAHADLRDQLGGDSFSHACAARRALDEGATRLLQIGVRAWCAEEIDFSQKDPRVETWTARSIMAPSSGTHAWDDWLEQISRIEGPVHLTIDIDGIDAPFVPGTGTPVHGGLTFWHVVETIEGVFSAPNAAVISADICEIAPDPDGGIITPFLAAQLAAKIAAAYSIS